MRTAGAGMRMVGADIRGAGIRGAGIALSMGSTARPSAIAGLAAGAIVTARGDVRALSRGLNGSREPMARSHCQWRARAPQWRDPPSPLCLRQRQSTSRPVGALSSSRCRHRERSVAIQSFRCRENHQNRADPGFPSMAWKSGTPNSIPNCFSRRGLRPASRLSRPGVAADHLSHPIEESLRPERPPDAFSRPADRHRNSC